jgi:hypothetical protein
MAQGFSIHIGVNAVEEPYPVFKNHFNPLNEQEKYAQALFEAFRNKGFESTILLNSKGRDEQPTVENFVGKIKKLQNSLENEDLLVISFCGHGVQWRDTNIEHDEKHNENWVFCNRTLVDDDLNQLLKGFKNNPRIVVISNCCFAGGMADLHETPRTNTSSLIKNSQPSNKKAPRILWLSSTTKEETIPINSPAFIDAIIQQMKEEFSNYNDFFETVKKKTNHKNFIPNIQPIDPKKPDFRLESPFLISNLKSRSTMANKTEITGHDVVTELTLLNNANAKLVTLPLKSPLRNNADEAVAKMNQIRLRDGGNKQKSMGNYNRGFAFTKSELENLISGATFPSDFLGIQLCFGIKKFNKPQTFGPINGKKVTAKLDAEIFPVISLITTTGMSSEMYAPEVKDCIEVAGIKCPPLTCPPPPPPPPPGG